MGGSSWNSSLFEHMGNWSFSWQYNILIPSFSVTSIYWALTRRYMLSLLGTSLHHKSDPITRVIPCWVGLPGHPPAQGRPRSIQRKSTGEFLPGLRGWNKNGWSGWQVWSEWPVLGSWLWAPRHPACRSPRPLTPQGNLPHRRDWPVRTGRHRATPEESRGPRKRVFTAVQTLGPPSQGPHFNT